MVHIVVFEFDIVKTMVRTEIKARIRWLSASFMVTLCEFRLDLITFSLILVIASLFHLLNLALVNAISDYRIVVGVERAKI